MMNLQKMYEILEPYVDKKLGQELVINTFEHNVYIYQNGLQNYKKIAESIPWDDLFKDYIDYFPKGNVSNLCQPKGAGHLRTKYFIICWRQALGISYKY